MGRRALRKIQPEIDYSQHLLEMHPGEPLPPASHWFAQPAPVEVEVGSGKGLFLTTAAVAHPEHNFLGVEIAGKYARFVASKLALRQLPNARIVHGDAERLFRESLSNESVVAVHVYFPDPWWKQRHHKRRIMNERFLSEVTRVLEPGGRLHFWTDVEDYYRLSTDLIRSTTPLEGPQDVVEQTPTHDLDYRTHFERRTRCEGLPVYRAIFERPDSTARQ